MQMTEKCPSISWSECRQYSNQDMYITLNGSLYESFMQSENKKNVI